MPESSCVEGGIAVSFGKVIRDAVLCASLGFAAWGCSGPPASTAAPPPQAVSYDGRYEGTIQVTGAAIGTSRQQCATDPRISFDVRNSKFVYSQSHPNFVGTAPDLTPQATTPVYNVTITQDGSLSGNSDVFVGTIAGRVTGSHMAGQINGELCYYSFEADRVAPPA
jgi:hypothetical protein